MACGVPVISTDVGIVPEAFGPHQRNFLLSERSVPAMKAAVSRLLDDPAQLSALSRENLVSVKAWDWPIRVGAYADFLDRARLSFESRRSAASVAR
jgi:glycosyltransferase involved in cell wall biosynthesis